MMDSNQPFFNESSAATSVTQVTVRKLTDQEIEANCYNNRDLKRQALGTISKNELNLFCEKASAILESMDIRSQIYVKRVGLHDSPRFEIGSCSAVNEILTISNEKVTSIGLYFEHPLTEAFPAQHSKNKNEDRYIVWVYRTIKGKALTVLRKFLLNSIIYYEKPSILTSKESAQQI
ncbi:hypothetical protein [Paenibacillus periandrae]|uniref:hypothetical protein n=1 Tax=Paenibacillus periandrae TaxID=1761741 RepID=UPI001F098445|nr:hypothetical protein [Paenibacillus periandrae]